MAAGRFSDGKSWWQRQFGQTTRGRIAALLRRAKLSVEELASAVGITDNAVRVQLSALERDGLVRAAGARRDGNVGKPATLYEIAPTASSVFSNAYAPVLASVLAEARSRLDAEQLGAILKGAGDRLAAGTGTPGTFDDRVNAACALLAELGADAELSRTSDGYVVRGFGCPLSVAVEACPDTCRVLEHFLADVTGGDVRETCDRSDVPRCGFAISATKSP
jgi:DeoR family transcriptional regulator, suf operon transcriptional repressor